MKPGPTQYGKNKKQTAGSGPRTGGGAWHEGSHAAVSAGGRSTKLFIVLVL